MILTKEEKEKAVIDLYFNQNKTCRQIAEQLHMSLRDIFRIIKREEDSRSVETHAKKLKVYQDQKSIRQKSARCSTQVQAYKLFSEGKKCSAGGS